MQLSRKPSQLISIFLLSCSLVVFVLALQRAELISWVLWVCVSWLTFSLYRDEFCQRRQFVQWTLCSSGELILKTDSDEVTHGLALKPIWLSRSMMVLQISARMETIRQVVFSHEMSEKDYRLLYLSAKQVDEADHKEAC